MTILSQRDPRWKNTPLGTSPDGQTIGGYGCTITCLAMLAGLTPDEVNRRLNAVPKDGNGNTGYAQGVLLYWLRIKEAIPWLNFSWRGYSYDNEKVKAAIAKNGGCLVEVDFDGTPRTDDRHWVLYIGGGKMYDPWTGTERPTSDYPIVHGFTIIDKIGEPQGGYMDCLLTNTPENNKTYAKLVHNSTLADFFVNLLGLASKADDVSPETVQKSIAARDGKLTACEKSLSTRDTELAEAQQEVDNRTEQIKRLKEDSAKKEELLNTEIKEFKEAVEAKPPIDDHWRVAYEQEHEKYLIEAKAKGQALNDLAVAEARVKSLEDTIDNDDRITFYKLLRKFMERLVGKAEK